MQNGYQEATSPGIPRAVRTSNTSEARFRVSTTTTPPSAAAGTKRKSYNNHSMNMKKIRMWLPQEDEIFCQSYKTYPKDWVKISSFLPGRNAKACETYYKNMYADSNALDGGDSDGDDNNREDAKTTTRTTTQQQQQNSNHTQQTDDGSIGCAAATAFDDDVEQHPWLPLEKRAFDCALQKYGKDWDIVACCIPGRTKESCERYYYQTHRGENGRAKKKTTSPQNTNDNGGKGHEGSNRFTYPEKPYTESEKYLFNLALAKHGKEWDRISICVPGRTAESCKKYYYEESRKEHPGSTAAAPKKKKKRNIHASLMKVRWAEQEKEIFVKALEKHGTDFNKIASMLPGRTPKACSRYYKYYTLNGDGECESEGTTDDDGGGGDVDVDDDDDDNDYGDSDNASNMKYRRWTAKERELFSKGFELYGRSWVDIANMIPGRDIPSCERYFYRAFVKELPDAEQKVHIAWSQQEKEQFNEAFLECGRDFERISTSIPGRTAKACEQYFYKYYRKSGGDHAETMGNTSANKSSLSRWTEEEKDMFEEAFSRFGRNFQEIADAIPGRTVKACEQYFYKYYRKVAEDEIEENENSGRTNTLWTDEEKQMFKDAFSKHGKDFDAISESIPGRTHKACEKYYYKYYNKNDHRRDIEYTAWTQSEKDTFEDAFNKHGTRWQKISCLLEGRTPKACERYYYRVYKKEHGPRSDEDVSDEDEESDQGKKYKPYNTDEKLAFEKAYLEYGNDWEKVANYLPGRSALSCERYFYRVYRNQTGEKFSATYWTEDEKMRLREAVEFHGRKWENIAKLFPGRTAKACEKLYYKYFREQKGSSRKKQRMT